VVLVAPVVELVDVVEALQAKQRVHTFAGVFATLQDLGPMLWFWKYFRQNFLQKIGLFVQNTAAFLQKLSHT
jgi:hypothetical protein